MIHSGGIPGPAGGRAAEQLGVGRGGVMTEVHSGETVEIRSGVIWKDESAISSSARSGGSCVLNLTQVGAGRRCRVRVLPNGLLRFEIPEV